MSSDQTSTATAAPPDGSGEKQSREQSTISFPYSDLSDAISVAKGLMNCGGVPCEPDQLAAALSNSPTSGGFRTKIATARLFGLIETVHGKYQLTDLGFAIVDNNREKSAKVDAFLTIPLYKKVYEEFRNRQLPPRPAALQHAFVGFGVSQKQKDRARLVFDRSAQQAGFFDQGGRDRLIKPTAGAQEGLATQEPPLHQGFEKPPAAQRFFGGDNGGSGGNGGGRGYHPFIQGLLQTLPEPGTVWSVEGKAAWLEAAASAFKLIYQGDGRITIQAEGEPK